LLLKKYALLFLRLYTTIICLLITGYLLPHNIQAQVINNNLDPNQQQNNMFNPNGDSTIMKSKLDWKDEQARIYFNRLHSAVAQYPDTTVSRFHRFEPVQPWWYKDLGIYGTALRNQFFNPVTAPGLSLGYHIFDPYKYTLDSLAFYNTTRPYSAFSFMLGSKSEQHVSILHTQNISPGWNFAGAIRYITSEGFFRQLKPSALSGSFSTNYQSDNQRYYVAAGFVYNRFKQNESGGIVADSLLKNPIFSDRQLIDVRLPATANRAAAVQNMLRDWDFYLQNNYSFGRTDTIYNEDSTAVQYPFTPRFRLKHQLRLHSERHYYLDRMADSTRYLFAGNLLISPRDSLFGYQNWFYADNKFSLNGFIGKRSELVAIEAGLGNRIDRFNSTTHQSNSNSVVSNYVFGEIKKEAFAAGQWSYNAMAQFFFTGEAVGNFQLKGSVLKDLGKWGMLSAGFQQSLANAPYAWNQFATNYFERTYDFNKTSATQVWGQVAIEKLRLQIGISNHILANYLYYDETLTPRQQSEAFSVLQLFGRKEFRVGAFSLDNEIAWQQPTANAPVNLPALLLRHKLGVETFMFNKALLIATGLELRYHTAYYLDGYTPYFNQFYYQRSTKYSNSPECNAYFNFKIRNFRAFVLAGQLQRLVSENVMNAPGYPAQDLMFRFGFNWILIN
jgi:hypothetical protein